MTESSDCQPSSTSYPSPMVIDGSECDEVLENSEWLTRREVLERRSRRVKQLTKLYRSHYWALMEELKSKYKSYYWTYGKSPFKEDENRVSNSVDGTTENVKLGLGLGKGDEIKRCQLSGCKTKAMALTKFCHAHILSDPKQKLYKSCTYVIKRWDLSVIFISHFRTCCLYFSLSYMTISEFSFMFVNI